MLNVRQSVALFPVYFLRPALFVASFNVIKTILVELVGSVAFSRCGRGLSGYLTYQADASVTPLFIVFINVEQEIALPPVTCVLSS